MTLNLAFTPSGRITVDESSNDGADTASAAGLEKVAKGLASSSAEGLFALATLRFDSGLSPSCDFWRGFAARYLSELCQTPEGADSAFVEIPPPGPDELASLLVSLPPMPGAEYLSQSALEDVWCEFHAWVRAQVESSQKGLSGFLQERAPLWHQVGRVCFHLAENRRDPKYPFAFLATYAPQVTGGGRIQYVPLSKALEQYAGARNKKALVKLLSPVQLASELSPFVSKLVESGQIFQPLAWKPPEAYQFLKDVPLFEKSGVLVRLPNWWKKRPRARVTVTIGDARKSTLGFEGMLDFKVGLALGDQQLNQAEWRELMDAKEGLVLLRGQWVEVDSTKLSAALDHWKQVEKQAGDGVSFVDGMRLLAGASTEHSAAAQKESGDREWSFVDAGKWLGDTLSKLRNPGSLDGHEIGAGLKATLREYQKTGANWLYFLSSLGLGSCLADDMGLGKTIQVLALLLRLKDENARKPSLLVLPASLLANWKSEILRFAPGLRVLFVHPSQTPKNKLTQVAADPQKALTNVDVVLTTYSMVLRQPWLLDVRWRAAVLDEAQAIKNPTARQTKTVKRLEAETRIALTGTPVENRLGDLWSLFDFICPGLLGSQRKFRDFVKSLEQRTQDRFAPLRRLVGPYILRRMKTDKRVIADLPEKTEVRAYCGLSKRQATLYAKMVRELSDALKGLDGIKRRGLVLAYLMRFKQLCNHPSQLLGDGEFAPNESGKFARLLEICEEISSRQEKTLVFTQFREMTEPLSSVLAQCFGRGGLVLHGGTPVKQRQKLIDEFQLDGGPPYFVLSLKAGGAGLNLTAAAHVIHFDRWWNPAVENQATDRAFRIGQERNVLVHKFVCQGTVEEKIDALIQEKSQLAADLLEGGAEKMLTEMTDAQLIELVALDVDRVSL